MARHVVVLGASAAGCFAAAAAAQAGASVTVVERDVLPAAPAHRRGVPQDWQPHVFLHRGMLAAQELLPGLREDLVAAGG
ncbi:NAD(P)-binding protein, partial [Motilibacter deserti]|nr:FAD-binding protein [Motilibacter deserti]